MGSGAQMGSGALALVPEEEPPWMEPEASVTEKVKRTCKLESSPQMCLPSTLGFRDRTSISLSAEDGNRTTKFTHSSSAVEGTHRASSLPSGSRSEDGSPGSAGKPPGSEVDVAGGAVDRNDTGECAGCSVVVPSGSQQPMVTPVGIGQQSPIMPRHSKWSSHLAEREEALSTIGTSLFGCQDVVTTEDGTPPSETGDDALAGHDKVVVTGRVVVTVCAGASVVVWGGREGCNGNGPFQYTLPAWFESHLSASGLLGNLSIQHLPSELSYVTALHLSRRSHADWQPSSPSHLNHVDPNPSRPVKCPDR